MSSISNSAQNAPIQDSQLAPEEKTVTMVFPRPVVLTVENGRQIRFEAGVQEVPESLINHEWLKLSGAKKHTSSWMDEIPAPQSTDITDHHMRFLQSRGYTVDTVAATQQFFAGLSPANQRGFLSDAAAWRPNPQAEVQRRVQDAEGGSTRSAPGGPPPLSPNALEAAGEQKRGGQQGQGGQQPPPAVQDTGSGRDVSAGTPPGPSSAGSSTTGSTNPTAPAPAKRTPEGKASAGEGPAKK